MRPSRERRNETLEEEPRHEERPCDHEEPKERKHDSVPAATCTSHSGKGNEGGGTDDSKFGRVGRVTPGYSSESSIQPIEYEGHEVHQKEHVKENTHPRRMTTTTRVTVA